jgi:hypothetical protein
MRHILHAAAVATLVGLSSTPVVAQAYSYTGSQVLSGYRKTPDQRAPEVTSDLAHAWRPPLSVAALVGRPAVELPAPAADGVRHRAAMNALGASTNGRFVPQSRGGASLGSWHPPLTVCDARR